MQTVDDGIVRRQAVIRNRPSALPVAAGQVRHELLAVAVQIRITELVGNLVARAGHAVRRIVVAVDRELVDPCRVARGIHRRRAVRGQRCGFRLFCAFRSRRFLCDGGIALRREDVVHRVVCIQTNAQVVVTRFENVGFVDMLVVNRQFLAIHRHRDGLGFTGLEDIRLAEADKLHGCLLNRVRAVEFGVRLLTVDLHDFLACNVARVRHLHQHGEAVGCRVVGHAFQRLFKRGVRHAIAEGVRDFLAVHPAVALGREDARIAGRVALLHDRIFIARFVVLVADIDAFGFHQIVNRIAHFRLVARHAVNRHAADRARLFIRIGVDVGAEVLNRRGGQGGHGVGVHQSARGVHVAHQNLRHRVQTVLTGAADPQAGIHAVFRIVHPVHRHGVGGVNQHNRLAEALRSHILEQLALGILQFKVRRTVGEFAGVQVSAFAAGAPDNDNRRILVAVQIHAGRCHRVRRNLGNAGRRRNVRIFGEHAGRGAVGLVFLHLRNLRAVPVHHRSVDVQTRRSERAGHCRRLAGINLTGTRAAIDGINCAAAENGHAQSFFHRQRAVVRQQHRAFALNLLTQRLLPRGQRIIVTRAVFLQETGGIIGSVLAGVIRHHARGHDAQFLVDHHGVSSREVTAHQNNRQENTGDGCQECQEFCAFHGHLSLSMRAQRPL